MKAYNEIRSKADSNMLLQGVSGFFGSAVTLGVDVAVVGTHYVPLFNNIRRVYGRGPLDGGVIIPIVKNILNECLFDLVFDKVLGYVPVIGVYANVMCAKTMTWRLGVLFAMLASRGEEIASDIVRDCVFVIRHMFPQNNAYKLAQPDLETFTQMVTSVHNNSQDEFAERINRAKQAFR
ncbi:MAG: hypothetical protein LBS62_04180 [Clostridiales bacterium]|nr:hypothetical protein [Clostridiales bacterium]